MAKNRRYVRKDQGSKNRPTEKELHQLYLKLAELVDTIAESRHIETIKAYQLIDNIIKYYHS